MEASISSVGSELGVRSPQTVFIVLTSYFHLIFGLVNNLTLVFSVSLLLGQLFVFSLHLEHHLPLLLGSFIFKHTSHAGDSFSLLSVGLFFFTVSVICITVFTLLLFDPFFLSSLVLHHSLLIIKIFSFKLANA